MAIEWVGGDGKSLDINTKVGRYPLGKPTGIASGNQLNCPL